MLVPQHQGKRTQEVGTEEGFTLIELLVVMVIISVLVTVVGANIMNRASEARVTAARNQISEIEMALKLFRLDNQTYPSTEQGLRALVDKPATDMPNWNGPYLEKGVPKDPWGNEYMYEYPGKKNGSSFDIASLGRDKASGGENEDTDITNWKNEGNGEIQ